MESANVLHEISSAHPSVKCVKCIVVVGPKEATNCAAARPRLLPITLESAFQNSAKQIIESKSYQKVPPFIDKNRLENITVEIHFANKTHAVNITKHTCLCKAFKISKY